MENNAGFNFPDRLLSGSMIDIRKLFVTVLIVGIAGITIPQVFNATVFAVLIPIGCMVVYVWIGHSECSDSAIIEQFADSVYYLGFLFTLVALVVSLYFYRSDTLDTGQLVGNFSLALITTIIGLAVRIYFNSFRVDLQDIERQMLIGVDQAANDFVRKAKTITMQLEVSHDEIQNAIKKSIEVADQGINKAAKIIEERVNNNSRNLFKDINVTNKVIVSSIEKFANNLENIELPQDVFAEKLAEPIEQFINRLDKTQDLMKDLNDEQVKIHKSTSQIVNAMDGVVISTEKLSKSLEANNDKLLISSKTNDDFIKIVDQTILLSEEIQKITGNFAQQSLESKATIDNFKKLSDIVNKLPEGMDDVSVNMKYASDRFVTEINDMSVELKGASDNAAKVFESIGSKTAIGKQIGDDLQAISKTLSGIYVTVDFLADFENLVKSTFKSLETFDNAIDLHTKNIAKMGSVAELDINKAKEHQEEVSQILEESRKSLVLINSNFIETVEYITGRLKEY